MALIELSEYEINLLKEGLGAVISDYCILDKEEAPYEELLEKLNKVEVKG